MPTPPGRYCESPQPGSPGADDIFPAYDPGADPFVNTTERLTAYNKFKFFFPGLIFIPVRIIMVFLILGISALISVLALTGVKKKSPPEPLKGWRATVVHKTIQAGARMLLIALGFYRVKIVGKPASRREAPIVVANHAAAWEGWALTATSGVTFLSRAENAKIPLLGTCLRASQCLFVNRDNAESRNFVVDEIRRRSQQPGWPQLCVFPEGTTINQRVLLAFRTGAFQPGVPVQPVVVKYPFKYMDPTYAGFKIGIGGLILRLMSQWYNSIELTFLPVYVPSEEEKENPQLFANNVRDLMSEAGAVDTSEYNVEDYYLTNEAMKLGIPPRDAVIGMERLKRVLNLGVGDVKETMKLFRDMDVRRKGEITYESFLQALGMDDSRPLRATYSRIAGDAKVLNFRQFLQSVAQHSKQLTGEDEIRFAFDVLNIKGDGKITLDEISANMFMLNADSAEEKSQTLFKKIDTRKAGFIDYLQFGTFMRSNPSWMELFEQTRTLQRARTVNPTLEMLGRRAEGNPMTVPEFRQRVEEMHQQASEHKKDQ